MTLTQRIVHSLGQAFIKLVTRPQLVNPQLLLPQRQPGTKVYYVLETDRLSHQLLLRNILNKQQRQLDEAQVLFADSEGRAPLRETLLELIDTQKSNPELNTLIIPVAIFHGRLPHREKSLLNLLYAETWHKAGPVGSFFQLLVNGRQTLLRVDEPLQLSQLIDKEDSTDAVSRKTARVLRTHFSIVRKSIIGPDLSHRRTLISLVLNHPEVQSAIDQQAAEHGTSRHKIERHCIKTLDKIAANFSPTTARILDPILNWLWHRLYRKVRIHNIETVQEIAKTHHLIYLPCHRSHMDYLLLSWALYRHGLMIPHVAAGENLNIPVIGSILKRGGAIFMRRKFHGDPLYACLYKIYLEQMSHRGHSLEYFIEGGRSRTGRLLPAKTGLLSMTIESSREGSPKPVALIPIWIGYDRLVESKSYQQELAGSKKTKESFLNFFSNFRILKEKFGDTYLSFGTPIKLEQHLHPELPLQDDVNQVASKVMSEINQASAVPSSSLIATCLLGGSTLQSVAELSDKANRLHQLIKQTHPETGLLPESKASEWINDAQQMGQLSLNLNLVELSQAQAQEMSFYRNNIHHLLILSGLYLLLAHRLENPKTQVINRIIRSLYPFIQAELFLPHKVDELTDHLRHIRNILVEQNLLEESSTQSWEITANPLVNTLILTIEPILLRYYIVLKVLARYEQISSDDLIHTSQSIAERIHKEFGYSTPDYKDERILRAFAKQLLELNFAKKEDDRLMRNFDHDSLFRQASQILRPHMISLVDKQLHH
ncbi:glycerol-3-phosphate 1-O-acyltransferase PlsB [Neptuniibacter caesariensis]|uniref:Glycerol-3-phosphate acyltransferase n=1 Tax=Neptuniibacter caesariensis TaxID=207954 RepID=A0A7U8GR51_NEPCE|nr:glycerol-3-phosphate 1-O-acyltransferase PlsB [Neptuniibacter caesariensis]EAR60987.1 glycerol-3-phosphate acyltransferase [Neptuniibacter caesariensis]